MPAESPATSTPRITRVEKLGLLLALLLGAVLRLGGMMSATVEHFDEAVYASNLLFHGEDGTEFPMRQFYAPAFLPATIEWVTIFGQMAMGSTPKWWPMIPGLIAGLATIPSAWWIMRRWFGPAAGVAAALLIACDEFHASYSRTALTDVPLTGFVLWAVYWFWRAFQSGELRHALLAGFFTALAWWTKYNGWLPLAIAASGGVFWQICLPRAGQNWLRFLRTWIIAAATAFVLWSPVLWDCQKVGGYDKVAANHRSYVTGFPQWIPNLVRGFESLDLFTGWLSLAGAGIAVAAVMFLKRRLPADKRPTNSSASLLAECLLNAWLWGLVVATPMYFPYSRLWTPCSLVAMLAVATLISQPCISTIGSLAGISQFGLRFGGAITLLVLLASTVNSFRAWDQPACFERRDGIWEVCQKIRQSVSDRQALLVVGESDPAIWFHLRSNQAPSVMQSSFGFADAKPPQPVYVILGPMSQRMENIQSSWKAHEHQFEFVEEFKCPLSLVSLLDLVSPQELKQNPKLREPTIKLYRLRS